MELLRHQAGQWLLQLSIGGSLLMLLALVAMWLSRSAALRQRLGEVAVLASLLLAVLLMGPPLWSVPSWADDEAKPEAAEPTIELETAAGPWVFDPTFVPEGAAQLVGDAWRHDPQGDEKAPAVEQAPTESAFSLSWTSLLGWALTVYVGGAGASAAFFLIGVCSLRRLLARCKPAPDRIVALTQELNPGVRRVRVLMSDRVDAALSFGLWRPTIVLPSVLAQAQPSAELGWIIEHELTHLRRGDLWSNLMFLVGRGLFFHLPWFWALRRNVRLCQELVADAAACRAGSATEYAAFLLSLAQRSPAPTNAVAITGRPSELYRRLTMLLQHPDRSDRPASHWLTALWTLAFFGLAVTASTVRVGAQSAPGAPGQKTETRRFVIVVDGDKVKVQEEGKAGNDAKEVHGRILELVAPAQGAAAGGEFRAQRIEVIAPNNPAGAGQTANEKNVRVVVVKPDAGAKLADIHKKVEAQVGKHPHVIVLQHGADAATQLQTIKLLLDLHKKKNNPGVILVEPKTTVDGEKIKVNVRAIVDATKKPVVAETKPAGVADLEIIVVEEKDGKATAKVQRSGPAATSQSGSATTRTIVVKPAEAGQAQNKAIAIFQATQGQAKPAESVAWSTAFAGGDHAKVAEMTKAIEKAVHDWRKKEDADPKELRKAIEEVLKKHHITAGLSFTPGQANAAWVDFTHQGINLTAKPRMGVQVNAISDETREVLGLPKDRGVKVTAVTPGSPAEKAGVKAQDVIVRIGGKDVSGDAEKFAGVVAGLKAGESLTVEVIRKGQPTKVEGLKLQANAPTTGSFRLSPFNKDRAKEAASHLFLSDLDLNIDGKAIAREYRDTRVASTKSTEIAASWNGDKFTARRFQGKQVITVSGSLKNGKAHAEKIEVIDGANSNTYTSLGQAPAAIRPAVESLLRTATDAREKQSSSSSPNSSNRRGATEAAIDLFGIGP